MIADEPRTYSARWVFPASGPPIENGRVTIRGDKIVFVGPPESRAADEHLGNVALIPGLVNAHTHLDLSGARGLVPPTDPDLFTDWLMGVIAYRRTRTPDQTAQDIRDGLNECLKYGTTLIGDIAAEGQSWTTLTDAKIRAVVFRELIGLGATRAEQVAQEAAVWNRATQETELCRKGFSPHSPYSARTSLMVAAAQLCAVPKRPMTVHLAESSGEAELLYHRRGPFVAFLKNLSVWDESGLASDYSTAMETCVFAGANLFAHGNYLAPSDRIPRNSTIVYCARTHAAFGHPPHPFREFLERGVRVCLGTDSLASNPDLDILAEARFVRALNPDFPGETLLKMVTLYGAEALGWADETGSLEVGKSADFVAVPLPDRESNDPHALLFSDEGKNVPRRRAFRGV